MGQAAVKRRRAAPERSPRDWTVATLASGGVIISGYLAGVKLAGHSALFCETGSACDVVQSSRYAAFLGVPTAAWGALLYLVVAALALVGLSTRRWFAGFVLAVVAVAFSGYLTYLELFVLHALCPYCLVAAGLAAALLATLVARRPAAAGRRPARLVTVGVATAVVTIVFGVGAYVTGSDPGEMAYQEALARHLAGTGAVMYGAYW